MSHHRALVEPGELVSGKSVTLDAEESNHLRARRAEAADQVTLFDGSGVTAEATLTKAGKGWTAEVQQVERHLPGRTLILAVGAGDRDRFLSLAEKSTELGVTRLIPLITERSAQVETRLREGAIEKCRRRSRDACKQSGNPWATVVDDLTTLDELSRKSPDVRWLLAAPDGAAMPVIASDVAIGWLIGPEGGFSEAEVECARTSLGAGPVRFAKHVLRFETAAVVAAGVSRARG